MAWLLSESRVRLGLPPSMDAPLAEAMRDVCGRRETWLQAAEYAAKRAAKPESSSVMIAALEELHASNDFVPFWVLASSRVELLDEFHPSQACYAAFAKNQDLRDLFEPVKLAKLMVRMMDHPDG